MSAVSAAQLSPSRTRSRDGSRAPELRAQQRSLPWELPNVCYGSASALLVLLDRLMSFFVPTPCRCRATEWLRFALTLGLGPLPGFVLGTEIVSREQAYSLGAIAPRQAWMHSTNLVVMHGFLKLSTALFFYLTLAQSIRAPVIHSHRSRTDRTRRKPLRPGAARQSFAIDFDLGHFQGCARDAPTRTPSRR